MPANFKKNRGSGDFGMTDLLNFRRIKKTSSEIKTIGLIDELNCELGFLKAELKSGRKFAKLVRDLENSQKTLFKISAIIAGAKSDKNLGDEIKGLERLTDKIFGKICPLKKFAIPGKNKKSAIAHLVRAKTRIIEISVRELKKFNRSAVYLNRLSDYLFLLAILIE